MGDHKYICSSCNSKSYVRICSIPTGLLIMVYIVLAIYFFVGEITYAALIAVLASVLPFTYVCKKCLIPHFDFQKGKVKNLYTYFDKWIFALLPSTVVIFLLITWYPQTGLGRIVYLPLVYTLNSIFIIICFRINKYLYTNRATNAVLWAVLILVTIVLVIWSYPQDGGAKVWKMVFRA